MASVTVTAGLAGRMAALASRDQQLESSSKQLRTTVDELSAQPSYFRAPQPIGSGVALYWTANPDQDVVFGKEARELLAQLDRVYGGPWHDWHVVVLFNSANTDTAVRFSIQDNGCQPSPSFGTIRLHDESDFGPFARELAEAYHGCFPLADNRWEEGMAEAANQLALSTLGLQQSSLYLDQASYDTLNRPGVGKAGGRDWLKLAGSAFRLFEVAHPGFLKLLNYAIYDKLYYGADVSKLDLTAIAQGVNSDFDAWFRQQHVFDGKPSANEEPTAPSAVSA